MQPQSLIRRRGKIFTAITANTIENRAALRTAIAAVSAILVAFALHLEKPYWSGMTVVIVANIYVGSIIDKAILRIVGTVIGVWLGFFLARMAADSLFLYLLINLLLITVAVYYYNFSTYAYAYLLGALGAFIVIAQLAISPEEVFNVAIWRPIEIGLGVVISAAAALCLFPNNIHDNIQKNVSEIFDTIGQLFEQLKGSLLAETISFAKLTENNLALKRKLKKTTEMLGFMRRELGIKKEKIDQFRVLLDLFYDLSRAVTYFVTSCEIKKQEELSAFVTVINNVFTAICQDLDNLKKAFFTEKKIAIQKALLTENAIEALNRIIEKELTETSTKISIDLMTLLHQINTIFTSLNDTLINHQPLVPKKSVITKQQQLSSDPDVIKHSIKAGLAAILALSFWLVSNWPGGLNGIISSVVISIRKDLFEMKNISLHRFLGCLLGGSVALVPLAFFFLNLYAFILLVFFAVWGFSYFSFKYTKYAYIGLQANIALVICLAQAGGPPTELWPPLERFGGIIIGIAASFIVGNLLWRAHPLSLLEKNIKKLHGFLIHNMAVLFLNKGTMYDVTHFFWLTRGVMESLEEEHLNLRKQQRLQDAKKRFVQLTLIQATLSYISRGLNLEDARNVAETSGIELPLVEQELLKLYKEEDKNKRAEIQQKITTLYDETQIESFEQQRTSRQAINFLSYLKTLRRLATLRADLQI
ncbi:FUSC family protein [Legionella clemsonensis]|uniref:p-hydroxybenzoic acid efflux pump subunit AaeB n=1 Tax=Legionella clemsonensis TaxID=1867846 RepID=A0A222P3Z3_9GAMM|nr:FUSC family protein [Legionella clemsonensis]ASQ46553.1 p-hydroxybenzoic acid efflux pump subunit AaeB [Legionella clemsonensis]